jgi:hypothetical protein
VPAAAGAGLAGPAGTAAVSSALSGAGQCLSSH